MSETGEVKEEAPVSNLRLYEQLELNKAKKEEGNTGTLSLACCASASAFFHVRFPLSEFQKKYKANFAPPSGMHLCQFNRSVCGVPPSIHTAASRIRLSPGPG